MKKTLYILLLLLAITSCKSSKSGCDAYSQDCKPGCEMAADTTSAHAKD